MQNWLQRALRRFDYFVCDRMPLSSLLRKNIMNMPTTQGTLPSKTEVALARESGRILSTMLRSRTTTRQIHIRDSKGTSQTLRLPTSALRALLNVLTEIGQGNAVSILPIHAELTTQEAADLLDVSRPFLVQLLEQGDIPFHKVGTHRRVRYQDVIAYKQQIDAQRRKALGELTAQAQELGMGY
jgi:excisionase family DNA binding protein